MDPEVTTLSINNLTFVSGEFDSNVVGKIKNIDNQTLYAVRIVVESYNSNNQLIGVDEGDPSYTNLKVGDVSPFEVSIDQGIIKDLDHYLVGVKATNEEPKSLFDLADLANMTGNN